MSGGGTHCVGHRCDSWYLTDEGNVDLWPYDRETMTASLSRPDEHDFHVTRASAT
jgi:hypothetical protein